MLQTQLGNLRKKDSYVNVPDSVENITAEVYLLEKTLRQFEEELITKESLLVRVEKSASKILQACGWTYHPLA